MRFSRALWQETPPSIDPETSWHIDAALLHEGIKQHDLVPMIGQINRVYEVLARKRPLTLAMIRRLHRDLGIPAESLIGRTVERRVA